MAEYVCIDRETYNEILSNLPSVLADKFTEATSLILDYLVWTEVDAGMALDGELEDREITLDPDEYEPLKAEFLESSFECDWIIERVNETIAQKARDFLDDQLRLNAC